MNLSLITCEGKWFIPLTLRRYVLNCHHIYILNHGMDGNEAIIFQHFFPFLRQYAKIKLTDVTLDNVQKGQIKSIVNYWLIMLKKYHVINFV